MKCLIEVYINRTSEFDGGHGPLMCVFTTNKYCRVRVPCRNVGSELDAIIDQCQRIGSRDILPLRCRHAT